MADGIMIIYRDEYENNIMKITSNYVPKPDENVTLNGKNFKVNFVKHIVNNYEDFEEIFLIVVREDKTVQL
jgi:hypothetical protein